jgi:colanic acid/amylovoran biosynthesis glycosyltransferase
MANKKKILFLMPYLQLNSEGWMQYMLQALESELAGICAVDSQRELIWGQQVPVSEIGHQGNLIRRLLRKAKNLISYKKLDQHQRLSKLFQENLKKAIQQYQPSIILSHYGDFTLAYSGVFDLFDIPVFLHVHGYDVTINFRDYTDPERQYFAAEYCHDIQQFSRKHFLIANSYFTRNLLISDFGIDEDRILVNYLGVPKSKQKVQHSDSQAVQILHLGRLVDFKSPDRTIEAFNLACDKGLIGSLVIAGDGPMRGMCELLRMRSPYRDRIRFTGSVNAQMAKQLLLESHIFTQHNVTGEISSQRECLGISILEAMAVGLPVVSTNSGAISETVLSGETGILVEPGDVAGQSDALLQLSRSAKLRSQMGQKAIERVSEQFDSEQQCANLKSLMLQPRSPSPFILCNSI